MKFITYDQIKAQLRLDDDQAALERDRLEAYGEAAEEAVLDIIRRSLLDVVATYNGIPARLVQCTLLLVDEWYLHRSPSSMGGSLVSVPYAFDFMLKPLMRLSGSEAVSDVPAGILVSSDGRMLLDKDYRLVCGEVVAN